MSSINIMLSHEIIKLVGEEFRRICRPLMQLPQHPIPVVFNTADLKSLKQIGADFLLNPRKSAEYHRPVIVQQLSLLNEKVMDSCPTGLYELSCPKSVVGTTVVGASYARITIYFSRLCDAWMGRVDVAFSSADVGDKFS